MAAFLLPGATAVPASGQVITQLIEGGVVEPDGVTVDTAGNVYVAVRQTHKAYRITPSSVITEIVDATGDGAGGELRYPYGIAVDDSGNVYVAGSESDNVFKITPGGVITEIVDSSGDGIGGLLDRPLGITVDAAGNVYVAGETSDNAFKITPEGTVTEIIDLTGDGAGGVLDSPRDMSADVFGNVYVTGMISNNAFKIAPGGDITEIINSTGDGGGNTLEDPRGIATDESGNVFVTGWATDNAFKIAPGGGISEIIDTTGDGASALDSPRGIAVDTSGNAYVGGWGTDNAFMITPGGVVSEIIDSTGDGAGRALTSPQGIGADASGNVFVAGMGSNNVFKITPGGIVSEFMDATGDGTGSTLKWARGIAVDEEGAVYLAGGFTDNAFKITPGGVITEIIDSTGDGAGNALSSPVGLTVDGVGNVFVTGDWSSNAFKIGPGGVITQVIDSSGDGAGNILSGSPSLAADEVGNVYVAGWMSHNAFKVTPEGAITEIIDETGDGAGNTLSRTGGIAVTPLGDVFVTGWESHNAFEITPEGVITEIIDSTGDGAGSPLQGPRGIAVDASGNVYVAGEGSSNAFKITPGGTTTEIIDAAGDHAGNTLYAAADVAVDGLGNVYVTGDYSHNAFRISPGGVITEIIDAAGDGAGNPLDRPTSIAVDEAGNVFVTGLRSDNAFKIAFPVHVDENATGPTHDGKSWCGAYLALQDALAVVTSGALIRVANGTYTPDQGGGQTSGDQAATFTLANGVTIEGGYAGCGAPDPEERDLDAYETTLSGDLSGNDGPGLFENYADNSYHVVDGSGTDRTAVLDGFTIRSGNTAGCSGSCRGGGLYVQDGSCTVRNCRFLENDSIDSAGAVVVAGPTSAPSISECTFQDNRSAVDGGAVLVTSSGGPGVPEFRDCRFIANTSVNGGAASLGNDNTVMVNCEFLDNLATGMGGAIMFADAFGAQTIVNSTFSGNTADGSGGALLGHGGATGTFVNCTFSNNSASTTGSVAWLQSSSVLLMDNCVLWNSSAPQIATDGSGSRTLDYCCVQDGTLVGAGADNINVDPLLVDADGLDDIVGTEDDDLRLSAGSPGIDAADSTALPADVTDLDDDGDIVEPTPLDLSGRPRSVDDPDTADTGVPGSPVVDMGAYEYYLDCNVNHLPDVCDLDCGALDGNCNLPGCGQSADCNENDIPDECDIAACDSAVDPGCDDCNLNGVPDGCDIADETSADDFAPFGVPDECHEWDDGGADDDWSTPENWQDDEVPDNDGGTTYNVVIRGDSNVTETVNLDMPVTVNSLALLEAATLNVTSDDAMEDDDLAIVTGAGLLIRGGLDTDDPALCPSSNLYVAHDREIDVSAGQVTVAAAGVYQASGSPVSASLSAENLSILHGRCECPQAFGGLVQLTDEMSVTVSADFEMVGADAAVCLNCCGLSSRGGISPPPKFRVYENAHVTVLGRFLVTGFVDVYVGPAFKGRAAPTAGVFLGGDFANESTDPVRFDWTDGFLTMNGDTSQTFEVAGADGGGYGDNFAMGRLEVAAGSTVSFVDLFDNDEQGIAEPEALYVDELIFRADGKAAANITIDRCKVYYNTLIDEGAVINFARGGELAEIDLASPLPATGTDAEPKNRYVSFDPNSGSATVAFKVELTGSDYFPGSIGADGWVGEPLEVPDDPGVWVSEVENVAYFGDDWPAVVHVGDCLITPAAEYAITATPDEIVFSDPLLVNTVAQPGVKFWGDVVGGFTGTWDPANGVVNMSDIQAILQGFSGLETAPPLTWVDLDGEVPNTIVNMTDVQRTVSGFKGEPYPFSDPAGCP